MRTATAERGHVTETDRVISRTVRGILAFTAMPADHFWHALGMLAAALLLAGCSGGTAADTAAPSIATLSASASSISASPTPTPSPSGPVVLTKAAAAKRYEALICPFNAKLDKFNTFYDDAYVDDQASAAARKAAAKAAKAAKAAASGLMDDGYVWPSKIAKDVETVAVELYETSTELAAIDSAGYRWTGAEFAETSDAASRVRLRLDLPPRGKC